MNASQLEAFHHRDLNSFSLRENCRNLADGAKVDRAESIGIMQYCNHSRAIILH